MSPAQNAHPGSRAVTELDVLGVGPLLRRDGALVVVAGEVGGDGQAFDVVDVERSAAAVSS